MNTLKIILAALVALGTVQADNRTNTTEKAGGNDLQKAVVAELNVARTQPMKYVEYLKAHKLKFNGNHYREDDGRKMSTKEGVAAVDEAIEFLSKQKPLGELKFSEGLSLAALDHVEDTGPAGITGHTGADGSDAAARVQRYGKWEKRTGENISYGFSAAKAIVMQLIIDDGVADRGHRSNIYQPAYRVVGIAIGPHKRYQHMCVMDFAGGYRDDRSAMRKRKSK